MVDDKGRPRYGRAYADQLKQDLAEEMVCVFLWLRLCVSPSVSLTLCGFTQERRRAENELRMRKLRDQFKDQNRQIEEASSGASSCRCPVLLRRAHAHTQSVCYVALVSIPGGSCWMQE